MTPSSQLTLWPWAWIFDAVEEIATVTSVFQQAASTLEPAADSRQLEFSLQRIGIVSDAPCGAAAANDAAGSDLKQAA